MKFHLNITPGKIVDYDKNRNKPDQEYQNSLNRKYRCGIRRFRINTPVYALVARTHLRALLRDYDLMGRRRIKLPVFYSVYYVCV